ncbi:Gluconate 5-dehydrogenase [Pseudomonas fluorescens]|uniref:SDR family oxidoreductase n=1 Tax=Pseudomonas fluorescens TaxID=294 RepID=UPI00125BCBFD|nr:SDR family oxidoreductase [Pseudomonas fluorescens]CAG8865769.1 Gluconate 5-dehydrogenase [Pseudomonas fluorescens]VVP88249.1 Gluconate 5-dehydrogenase [Pseudomonas fluorescens]
MIDSFRLNRRRALITGSVRGIGLALARGLAQAGAQVVLNGRDAERAHGACALLRDEGLDAECSVFDVSDHQAAATAVDTLENRLGPIDILVNNAGLQHRQALQEVSAEDWHRLMSINLDGVFNVSKAVARHMIARRRGKIINIGSVQSELARPSIAAYAASKGAVRMLTRGMCADWAAEGLQINALAPGYFQTDLTQALVDDPAFSDWLVKRTPAGRWGRVEELCGAAVFLASPASDFVNGQTLFVDGGLTSVV